MKNKFSVLVSVFAVTCSVFLFTGCGAKKLDLNKCVSYEFEGYDGYGHVKTSYDEDAILAALMSGSEDDMFSYFALSGLDIDGDWTEKEGLSNGDKITYEWDIDKDEVKAIQKAYNVKLKYKDFSVKVKGLKDPDDFDVKEYIDVVYSGASPVGEVAVYSKIDGLDAKVDKQSGLANGDKIIVTLEPKYLDEDMESVCQKNNIPIIKETSIEYTVDGLKNYVSSAEEIPEKTVEILKKKTEAALDEMYSENHCATAEMKNWFGYKHTDFSEKEFDRIIVDPAKRESAYKNVVYVIYKVSYEDHGHQETYLGDAYTGVYDSVEGLTEDDIRSCEWLFSVKSHGIENKDTDCKMVGMTREELEKYFEGIGLQY